MSNKKITIICPSILPVPAVKGGAVENLLESFIKYNSKNKRIKIDLITIYDKEAESVLRKYSCIKGWQIKNSTLQIRLNTILKSYLLKKLPVTYYNKIISKIQEIGNKTVLVEGGLGCAIEIKRKLPSYNIYYHSHGLEFDSLGIQELKIVNSFSGIFFVSHFCLNRAVDKNVSKDKCYFLKNRIEISKFNYLISNDEKNKFRKKYGIEKDKINIVFKGRIVEEKGIIELIKAFYLLNKPDCTLLICGGKNFGKKNIFGSKFAKKIKKEIRCNKQIKFLGYVPYSEIPILNSITSVAVLPSRWDDPAPLALIESIVSCIPTLASNRGGISEYAESAGVELIDEERFIDSLYEKINILINNREKMEEMKEQSKKNIKKFDFEEYYDELCDFLLREKSDES